MAIDYDLYENATVSQRYEALQKLLADYKIEFFKSKDDEFLGIGGMNPIVRKHWTVSITKEKTSFDFKYFAPEHLKKKYTGFGGRSASHLDYVPKDSKEKREQDRLVGFIWCLALDFDYLDSEGIKDQADYIAHCDAK